MAIMLAIIVYQNSFEHRVFFWADTIPYLRNLVHEHEDVIRQEKEANVALETQIKKTNFEIDQWKRVSDDLEEANVALKSDIKELRSVTRLQIRNILNAPTPQSCEAAVDFLRDVIPSLQFDALNLEKK